MRNITLGDPLDEATEIGPISNARQFTSISGILKNVGTEGGTVDAAECPDNEGLFVAPTMRLCSPNHVHIFVAAVTISLLSFSNQFAFVSN